MEWASLRLFSTPGMYLTTWLLPPQLAQMAGGPNLVTYFLHSNLAGQVIVILLLLFSVLAWTVMIGKHLDLKRLNGLNHSFARTLARTGSILRMERQAQGARGPFPQLLHEGLLAYRRYGRGSPEARLGHVENALQRAVADQSLRYENKMVLLGSIVTGAPFMGLLGTVWGVMDAFGGMAAGNSAGIQSLAPGVSGALLTTVAGLVVAIPSVFGYNFLLSQTKMMVTDLENFASSLADRIELEAREAEDPPLE